MSDGAPAIYAAVEGDVDDSVVRRLIHDVGAIPGPVLGKNGKAPIRARIRSFNRSANALPWLGSLKRETHSE
jgi:hypothetical protein